MHMNSAPHLLNEDRPEFERILDEALRTAPNRPDLAAVGQRLNPEQLRTMALNAAALISAAAASEYQHYISVREDLRTAPRPQPLHEGGTASGTTSESSGGSPMGFAATVSEVAETTGPGIAAVAVVLFPVLAGTAAAIFLLVGYILKMLNPPPDFAGTLLSTGWIFGALTAAGILVAAVCLLLAALRNGATSLQADAHGESNEAVAQAREAWTRALLERGILPFLREALADPPSAGGGALGGRPGSVGRMPQLGYNRPGFSSPDGGGTATGQRAGFSSPDFSSPDFGGPEHQPD
ncbi:hypothetical protein [Streptomyces sp. VRA16 Mangrove soil]|uniref:hypothetical protein n=1 Tax=Streptomyces sp. VRA16 Mangrove soil TaxID=2817434 RepID=UPI001A9D9940|nr:hypothetical protein [Streptomyces sp. VRA16 Mangrove soil]MBO1336746.1 hypothetical protein [Streptomyces sp. VRA16 Mangrove soil]